MLLSLSLLIVVSVVVWSVEPFFSMTDNVIVPVLVSSPVPCPTGTERGRGRGMSGGEEGEGRGLEDGTRTTDRPPAATTTTGTEVTGNVPVVVASMVAVVVVDGDAVIDGVEVEDEVASCGVDVGIGSRGTGSIKDGASTLSLISPPPSLLALILSPLPEETASAVGMPLASTLLLAVILAPPLLPLLLLLLVLLLLLLLLVLLLLLLPSARLSVLFPPGDCRTCTGNTLCSPSLTFPPSPSTLLSSPGANVTAALAVVLIGVMAGAGRIFVVMVGVDASVIPLDPLEISIPCPCVTPSPCPSACPCIFSSRRSPFHSARSRFINCNNRFLKSVYVLISWIRDRANN